MWVTTRMQAGEHNDLVPFDEIEDEVGKATEDRSTDARMNDRT